MIMETQTQTGARILIADDQTDVLSALQLLLKAEGYETEAVTSPRAVLESLETGTYDVLLVDLNYARDTTSGQEGLDLITQIRAHDPNLPVIAMTAWGSVEVAVEAMRGELRDFIQKPWDNDHLLNVIQSQIDQGRSVRQAQNTQNHEQDEALAIQRGLMPTQVPDIPGYDIVHDWRPAKHVSGDYFDVLSLSDTSAGLCIADVVGKGMAAALLMSNIQALVHAYASDDISPHLLCSNVNRTMAGNIPDNKFVTFFYAHLDTLANRLTYTNAGHNDPILVRPSGDLIRLNEGGLVLGTLPEWTYDQGEVTLAPGDRVVLFTDGVNEAMSPDGEEFGDGRLMDIILSNRLQTPDNLRQTIMDAVAAFCHGEYRDDVTVMVIGVL